MILQQKISPFLGFKDQAEQAANFYVSALPDSKILKTVRNPATGEVLTVEFQLSGLNFIALNAGQEWKFTESVSFAVGCEMQSELDELWEKLSDGGRAIDCGWLQDQFGVFWQLVPSQLSQWLGDSDAQKVKRVLEAAWQMKKLDIAKLQQAYDG